MPATRAGLAGYTLTFPPVFSEIAIWPMRWFNRGRSFWPIALVSFDAHIGEGTIKEVKASIERLEWPAYRCEETSIRIKGVNRSHESSVAIVD